MCSDSTRSQDIYPNMEYAREKLGMAVWKLATGTGTIRPRLMDAFIELAVLQEGDMPDELWTELKAIRHELTRGNMQYDKRVRDKEMVLEPRGSLYSTVGNMRLGRAQSVAERICTLEEKVRIFIGGDG